MPIYEYRCGACGHYMDVLQKISDAPLTDCPECNEAALKRLISAPSFRLKGGGWYETDFKSEKERKRNLAESGKSDAASDGKPDSKSGSGDGKTEKKAESSSSSDTKKAPEKSKGSGTEAA